MGDRHEAALARGLAGECLQLYRVMLDGCRQIEHLRGNTPGSTALEGAVAELLEAKRECETAVDRIMTSAERLIALDTSDADAVRTALDDHCAAIFEACSFQDITGQRLSKALNMLRLAGTALEGLHGLWAAQTDASPAAPTAPGGDSELLNGPALAGEGLGQDAVDFLLAAGGEG